MVAESIQKGKSYLVVLASDVSARTREQITSIAGNAPDPVRVLQIPETMFDLSSVLGRRAGVLSVNDEGLAGSVVQTADMMRKQGGESL